MTTTKDAEQLQLLSVFHYVVGGLMALFSLFPLIHLGIGIAILSGAFDNVDSGPPPPPFLGWMFVVLPSIFILFGMTVAICILIAGKRLQQSRHHTYCLIVAAIECLFMPFGTILGVFTIVVLMRPGVKELFGVAAADDP